MKAYKVDIEKLAYDTGKHQGWENVGYYANKEKAERIAKGTYEIRNRIVRGDIRITEIEIN